MEFIWTWLFDHIKSNTVESIVVTIFAIYLSFRAAYKFCVGLKTIIPTIREHINIVRELRELSDIEPKLDKIIEHQQNLSRLIPGLQKSVDIILQIQNIARYDCTPDGNCLSVNEIWSKWTGISEKDALGQGWVISIHEDDRHRVCAEWDEAIAHKRPFVSKFRYKHAYTGIVINVISNSHNIVDENGELIYIIGINKLKDNDTLLNLET